MLRPDFETICVAPGYKTPTAFVFADAYHTSGEPYDIAPRYVLKRVMEFYEREGLRPVVAPELEFYLTQVNTDPDLPLDAAGGPLRPLGNLAAALRPRSDHRIRRSDRDHLRARRSGLAASRHHDPRKRHRPARDQFQSRRPGARVRSGAGVQAHRPPSGAEARRLRHFHGQADGEPARQRHAPARLGRRCKEGHQSVRAPPNGDNTDMFRHFVGGLQKYLGE